MKRRFPLVLVLLLGISIGLEFPREARAFWWWAPCGGFWCGPWSCYGYWYLGIRPGPIRRLLFGPYRWYWVPGDCAWTVPCCLDDCSCLVQCSPCEAPQKPSSHSRTEAVGPSQPAQGQMDLAPAESQRAIPAETAPGGPMPLPSPDGPQADAGQGKGIRPLIAGRVLPPGAAEIRAFLPAEARVTINGHATQSTGPVRRYVSYGLEPGKVYRYEITIELVDRLGRTLTAQRTVWLRGGEGVEVAVTLQPSENKLLALVR